MVRDFDALILAVPEENKGAVQSLRAQCVKIVAVRRDREPAISTIISAEKRALYGEVIEGVTALSIETARQEAESGGFTKTAQKASLNASKASLRLTIDEGVFKEEMQRKFTNFKRNKKSIQDAEESMKANQKSATKFKGQAEAAYKKSAIHLARAEACKRYLFIARREQKKK